MCVLMPTQVLVLVLVLGHQVLVLVLVLGHQVLVLVLVLESQVLDNNTGLESEISKEMSEHLRFREPHCHSASPSREPLRIFAQTLYIARN